MKSSFKVPFLRINLAAITLFILCCNTGKLMAQSAEDDFGALRNTVTTSVGYNGSYSDPMPTPPPEVFNIISYQSPAGALKAYISPNPNDGKKHPAIIWITGGESNSLSEMWGLSSRSNDQTASAYCEAGIIMMAPSLRGGNDNPGKIEGFVGEIDDIISAAEHLESVSYVDPDRIYLGGHSTGGTLVFLTAAASDKFKASFSFGPLAVATHYGDSFIKADFDTLPEWETVIRAPIEWMDSVGHPLFVIEGTEDGNADHLRIMDKENTNSNITFIEVPNASHFSVLAPTNEVIAQAILQDKSIDLSVQKISASIER